MKKKVFSLLLTVAMLVGMIPFFHVQAAAENATAYDTTWYSETATTLEITDAADLLAFSYNLSQGVTYAGQTIVLKNDIDLNPGWDASTGTAPANQWFDISNQKEFAGVFDGQNNTISGIYLAGTANHTGIFGSVKSGTATAPVTIKNLAILNSYVTTTGNKYTGALVASIPYSTESLNAHLSIENVYLDADVVIDSAKSSTTTYGIGGFIGYITYSSTVTINNCVYAGNITLKNDLRDVGGIVGWITGISADKPQTTVAISNCGFYGSITTNGNRIGGIVGRIEYATCTITDCIAAGELTPASWVTDLYWIGSIVAANYTTSATTITDSLYIDCNYWVKEDSGKVKTPVDNPFGTVYKTSTKNPTMTTTNRTTPSALTGIEAQSLFTNMSDWTATTTSYPIPKALLDIAPIANADSAETPVTVFKGFQATAASSNRFNLRLVAVVADTDLSSYASIGFKIVANYGTGSSSKTMVKDQKLTSVYEKLTATTANGYTEYTNEALGGYIYALNCNNVPSNAGVITFEVTTYYETKNGEIVDGATVLFEVDPSKDIPKKEVA